MSSSLRGPGGGHGGSLNRCYVPELERVCAGIERGHKFNIEPRPGSELARAFGVDLVRGVYLHILDGGDVIMRDERGTKNLMLGMTLGNYNRLWRAWIGTPSPGKMKDTWWRMERGR